MTSAFRSNDESFDNDDESYEDEDEDDFGLLTDDDDDDSFDDDSDYDSTEFDSTDDDSDDDSDYLDDDFDDSLLLDEDEEDNGIDRFDDEENNDLMNDLERATTSRRRAIVEEQVKRSKGMHNMMYCWMVTVIVAVEVILALTLTLTKEENRDDRNNVVTNPKPTPTDSPSLQPSSLEPISLIPSFTPASSHPSTTPTTIIYEPLFNLISTWTNPDILTNSTTPQYQAYMWLTTIDTYSRNSITNLTTSSEIVDTTATNNTTNSSTITTTTIIQQRYIMAVLYYSTNGTNWSSSSSTTTTEKHIITTSSSSSQQDQRRRRRQEEEGIEIDDDDNTTALLLNFLNSTLDVCEWNNNDDLNIHNNATNNNGTLYIDDDIVPTTYNNESIDGVMCNDKNEIISIQLESYGLQGELPSEIVYLTNLETLNLANNDLMGFLPPGIRGGIPTLKVLSIFGNSLRGDLDAEFCGDDGDLLTTALDKLEADCAGPLPEVNCTCCTLCCSMTTLSSLEEEDDNDDNEILVCEEQQPGGPTSNGPNITNAEAAQRIADLVAILTPISGDAFSVGGTGTPQYEAVRWIATQDPLFLNFNNETTANTPTIIERYLMTLLYYSTNGTYWYDQELFVTHNHVCDWSHSDVRIVCSDNDYGYKTIVKLDLSGNNLNGIVPAEIQYFQSLDELKLNRNSLIGRSLVSEIGVMTNLEHLDFSENNGIIGTVPSELGQLINLQYLNLAGTLLSGEFPITQIGALPRLEALFVNKTQIMGDFDTGFCPPAEQQPFEFLVANCLPNEGGGQRQVSCSCCTTCCDADGEVCTDVDEVIV